MCRVSGTKNTRFDAGLDRFQIEELEHEYFEMRAFPPQLLEAIQRPPV